MGIGRNYLGYLFYPAPVMPNLSYGWYNFSCFIDLIDFFTKIAALGP